MIGLIFQARQSDISASHPMQTAHYMGDGRSRSVDTEAAAACAGQRAARGRLHRHLRHRPAHPPRRDGRTGHAAGGPRPRDGRPRRGGRRGSQGWADGRRSDRHATRLVRRLRRVPGGALAHLPAARLHGHRRARVDAVALDRPGARCWCRCPADLSCGQPRWPSRPRSRCTTCAVRSSRQGSTRLSSAPGQSACSSRRGPREVGAEVVVVEPNARRRAGRRTGRTRPRSIPGRGPWRLRRRVDRGRRRGGRLRGLGRGRRACRARSTCSACGAGWWWSPTHPTPPQVDLLRVFWRELTLIGARVYERADFEKAVRLLADGDDSGDALISDVVPLAEVARRVRGAGGGRRDEDLVDCAGEAT